MRKAWIIHFEDDSFYLYESNDYRGPEDTISLVRMTREQLRATRPRLYRALVTSQHRDTPRIVREP
jgi:hypothetical protein